MCVYIYTFILFICIYIMYIYVYIFTYIYNQFQKYFPSNGLNTKFIVSTNAIYKYMVTDMQEFTFE